jgi:outer membrane protein assembly factor BamA
MQPLFTPKRCILLRTALAFLLFSIAAATRTAGQERFRLASVEFEGLKHYTPAQVSAVAGLRAGQSITPDQLAGIAERLAQTGAFVAVSFRYTMNGSDLAATFLVKETDKLLPCTFDNFVWFAPDSLNLTMRQRVPLYDGEAPVNGQTLKDIAAALQDVLRINGVPGGVETIPYTAGVGQPVSRMIFRASGVAVPIRAVQFPGAAGLPEKTLQGASEQLIGHEYSSLEVALYIAKVYVPLYGRHGYLRAQVGPPQAHVLPSSANPKETDVSVSFPVNEGSQYRWEKADWSGNQSLSAEQLDGLLAMKPGELANLSKIDAGIEAVQKSYEKRGYVDATIQSKSEINDQSKQVRYEFALQEGLQYHFSQVHFQGLPDKMVAQLVKKWRMKPGDAFDSTYAADFVKTALYTTLQVAKIKVTTVQERSERDTKDQTVDVYIVVP